MIKHAQAGYFRYLPNARHCDASLLSSRDHVITPCGRRTKAELIIIPAI
jgi:hypothetical protein